VSAAVNAVVELVASSARAASSCEVTVDGGEGGAVVALPACVEVALPPADASWPVSISSLDFVPIVPMGHIVPGSCDIGNRLAQPLRGASSPTPMAGRVPLSWADIARRRRWTAYIRTACCIYCSCG